MNKSIFKGYASQIESIENKTTEISENSTDTQYPSAAAVYKGFVAKENGKGLSANDFTNEDKEKLNSTLQADDIDQTYTPTSPNAQSGLATAEAVGVANDYTDKAIKSSKNYANNTFAPAIKNTVSGGVLAVHDVSPVEHDLDVRVRSKNLIPYPYADTTKTENGVTFTDNGDGSITLNGTPTTTTVFHLYIDKAAQTILYKGQAYALSLYNNTNLSDIYLNTNISISGEGAWGTNIAMTIGTVTKKFTVNESYKGFQLYLVVTANAGTLENVTVYPQIELGTTATDYTPYVSDLSTVGVSRYGKNLFNVGESEDYFVGDSILNIENNTISGQIRDSAIARAFKLTNYPSGDYSVSFDVTQNRVSILIRMFDSNGKQLSSSDVTFIGTYNAFYGGWITNNPAKFTIPDTVDYWQLGFVFTGTSFQYATATNIQLEKGLNITSYEPYNGQTVTANADGTVEGLTSLYPNTTLMTDTNGVIIDCEYLTKSYTDILGSTNLRNGSAKGSIRSINSKAEDDTYTIGTNAFAEGNSTKASGDYSHAEGSETTASGNSSHAEGEYTVASVGSSHAEGYRTIAGQMGFQITACEKLTDTTGTYTLSSVTGLYKNQRYSVHLSSSKENCGQITAIDTTNKKITVNGYPDIALSSDSYSNYLTIVKKPELGDIHVSGESSHAEGFYTAASGESSHAEGFYTAASGKSSHTEGYYTIASSDYQHVQGKYNIGDSSNIYADIIGNGSSDTKRSNASTVDWNGNAWYAGDVYVGSTSGKNKDDGSKKLATEDVVNTKMDKTNPTGTGSFSLNRKADTTVGNCSFAEGTITTASGLASHAEGSITTASGDYSHAEGFVTAAGQMGFKVTACEKLTDTTGTYTLTSLTGLSTNRRYSVHLSSSKKNCGKITAIDTTNKKITVDGYPDIALSTSSSSIANYLTIVNKPELGDIHVSGDFSHAEGYSTKALGNASHAEGDNTQASGNSSHAEGARTTASGDYSHAEGSYTTASGEDSHAEGKSTQASGDKSHAEGFITVALGNFSHAEGFNTKASGSNSHAEGESTTASSAYQHVQGKYNIEDKNNTYADIIGNGSSNTNRSNAYTLDWSGNAWYAGDVYVGSTSGKNKDEGSKKLATEEYTNNIINKKIEVSETAPTEEENKIWLQPMITNVGAVDYIVEQGISGLWTERKWNSGRIDRLIDRQFFYTDNPDVLGYAENLMANGFDGVVTIQLGNGAEAPTTYCMGQIICNGSDRCEVIIYGTNVIYTNLNQKESNGWVGWYKFSGTAV